MDAVEAYQNRVLQSLMDVKNKYEFVNKLSEEDLMIFKNLMSDIFSAQSNAAATAYFYCGIAVERLVSEFGFKPWGDEVEASEEDFNKLLNPESD